ncbi:hypothetical protein BD408DRAFT_134781 [Parasitella parasitica]|nr:hypothetical protein BD408DRAFT_134781 [Parasitella parasitica]
MSWQALNTIDTIHNNQYGSVGHQKSECTSDDEDYQTESDSEYEDEIEVTAWGENATKEKATWSTLIDPSIKIKAGGIGSGGLHRKGVNFKPISEQAILAQRLGTGVPSKQSASSKTKKSKKKKSASIAPHQAKPAAALLPGRVNHRPYVPVIRPTAPARALARNQPGSMWGSAPLSVTPFWEKKQEMPKPTVSVAAPSQNPGTNGFSRGAPQNVNPTPTAKRTPSLTSESLPAYSMSPAEVSSKENEPKPTAPATKWNIDAQDFDPSKGSNPVLKPGAAVKWNTKVPSFVPSTASTSTSSAQSSVSNPLVYNADAPVFIPTFVPPPPIKKILKITSPTPKDDLVPSHSAARETKSRVHLDQSLLRKHLDIKPFVPAGHAAEQTTNAAATAAIAVKEQQQQQQQQQYQQSQFQARSSSHSQLESQTRPESTRGFEPQGPFLRINLEISEGISTTIIVQEGSDPDDLAEEFGIKHRLKMTSLAKKNMASFISTLIEKKKNEKKFGLID